MAIGVGVGGPTVMLELSANTQAILLLTAPLIAGRAKSGVDPLSGTEYRRLARRLREVGREPADLLESNVGEALGECRLSLDSERLERLLGRGFLLSQALERWRTRAIWVMSRADAEYPWRFKRRVGENAPPILYGCGDTGILDSGGLAVVGSRNVDQALIEYAEAVGRLTAAAGRTLVSGGARGIDQAAMRGALSGGGRVMAVMADGLEKAVLRREYRDPLIGGRLLLISPYDPAARFQVGHAMQRNKLIYALASAALAVNSDYQKGGTWTGAVEQLDKLKFVPVYVRANGETGRGLDALRERGAMPWPEPRAPEELSEILEGSVSFLHGPSGRRTPPAQDGRETTPTAPSMEQTTAAVTPGLSGGPDSTLADALLAEVRRLIERMDMPVTEAQVAERLQVTRKQANVWLKRLVEMGVMERLSRPARFRFPASSVPLFDSRP